MFPVKLCLGTAQFGLNYGINNKFGKPDKIKIFQMLDMARHYGIGYLDTAAGYGDAQIIIGEYFAKSCIQKDFKVVTKIGIEHDSAIDKGYQLYLEEEIVKILKTLHSDVLNGLLLHHPEDMYREELIEALLALKRKGYVQNIGVSIYEPAQALDAVKSMKMDYIQIPYNVFDKRLEVTNFFEIAQKNHCTVFGRSTFLQGLIFMKWEEIPGMLFGVKKHLLKFDEIISKYGFNRFEAAFLYAYANEKIGHLVFGIDQVKQLDDFIDAIDRMKEFHACRKELEKEFMEVEKEIINPSLWKTSQ